MSDSVSRFQAEVAAVMQLVLKVAVLEITKVFEGRSFVSCPASGGPELDSGPDLRACLEHALRGFDKAVCSVGVQVGEESNPDSDPDQDQDQDQDPDPHDKGSPREGDQLCVQDTRVGDGLPSTGDPCLDLLETVDVQCTFDVPCNIFKEKVVKEETGDDLALQTIWLSHPQAELAQQEDGPQVPSLLHDSFPGLFSSDTPSADLNTLGQSGLALEDLQLTLPKVELSEPAVGTDGHGEALPDTTLAAADAQIVRFQLSQTPFDCKLLQPCSVQLVNLLRVSASKQRIPEVDPCGKSLHMPKDLRIHQHAHTGHRLCCYTRVSEGAWHLREGASHRRSHLCRICGKKFKRRKILRRHERFHTGEKPYPCSRCHKSFTLRKSLRRHQRFHTGERPHSCVLCCKSFRLKDSLKAHLRFHTGEKPFACDLCSKRFRIRKNLHKHSRVHSTPGVRTLSSNQNEPACTNC